MIKHQTLLDLEQSIGPVLAEWTDEVVPESVDLLKDHHYSPRYAWMYAYEKRLKYRIADVRGGPLGSVERDLFGADGVLSEALSNAFVHGNKRNPSMPIVVVCRVATQGLLFTIRDRGQGFDVPRAVADLARGGTYFHMAGNGLRSLASKKGVAAAYDEGGRVLHIRIFVDQPANA